MRTRHLLTFPAVLLAGLVPALPAQAAAPSCSYKITVVAPIGQYTGGVFDINNRGQAAGSWGNSDTESRVYFFDGRTPRDIGSLGGRYTTVLKLTDSGYLLGYGTTPEIDEAGGWGGSHGFLWHRGVLTDLSAALPPEEPPPPSIPGMPGPVRTFINAADVNEHGVAVGIKTNLRDVAGIVYDHGTVTTLSGVDGVVLRPIAINNAGQVTGQSQDANSVSHAFLWQDGAVRDLGVLPGGTESSAADINEAGHVVGYATTAEPGEFHAVLWRRGHPTDLGALGGPQSMATAVNDHDQVIGTLATDYQNQRAFFWERGRMTDLGTLGGTMTAAFALNNRGQAVGYSMTAGDAAEHAFVAEHGRLIDLGVLPGGQHSGAQSINDRGQVAGWANDADGQNHGVIWTPTC